jgi:cysteine desulfurase
MLDVDQLGLLRADQFERLPWNRIKLATVILAHNETGVVQDTRPLSVLCGQYGVPLHIDAVQAVGKIPVRFHELGAAALSLGAHKFHGPRGVGALLLRDDVRLAPITFGGHQESERRPGTESVALIAGMARALELCIQDLSQRTQRLVQMRDALERGLSEMCEPVVVNGSRERRLPNTLNSSFPGVDGEALLVALDLEGIACSLGSACASGSAEPAPALVAMGCAADVYKSAVRFTISTDNTIDEMAEAAKRIARVVSRLRNLRAT